MKQTVLLIGLYGVGQNNDAILELSMSLLNLSFISFLE